MLEICADNARKIAGVHEPTNIPGKWIVKYGWEHDRYLYVFTTLVNTNHTTVVHLYLINIYVTEMQIPKLSVSFQYQGMH